MFWRRIVDLFKMPRIERREVFAVHEHDIEKLLSDLGLLEPLKKGELRCSICGTPITIENIQCIYPFKNKILVCCDSPQCYKEVLRRKGL